MVDHQTLTGFTWNRRGALRFVASAHRLTDALPEADFVWERRSLPEFADFQIDHPDRKSLAHA